MKKPLGTYAGLLTTVLLLVFSHVSGLAQALLWSDAEIQQVRGHRPAVPDFRANTPDTLTINASRPFFDDFSGRSALPDTTQWFIPEIDFRVPTVMRNGTLAPPTPGMARFDGLRRNGIPYETLTPSTGPADRLISHYLDFTGIGAGSNFWLYCYVESGGLGDKPESNDSLSISLITPTDTFLLASRRGGQSLAEWIAVPMDQAGYFNGLGQLQFESFGSQNGLLDVWLVDYVYLGPEWSGGVSNLNERGPVRLLSTPIEPYFALPLKVYEKGNDWQKLYEVTLKQNGLAPYSGTLHTEWVNGSSPPVSPYVADVSVSIPGNGTVQTAVPASASQDPAGQGTWHAIHYLAGSNDRFAGNDTLGVDIRMDSLMGYDDGVPDGTFGLNKSLGFGLRFDLPEQDTVEAIWMHFSPLVHVNGVNGKVTYLQDKVFRLRFWDKPHPDSFFVEQVADMKVTYRPEGEYVRFALVEPAVVPTTFWVGIQQLDDIPIGLGFDASYDRDSWVYWDSLGNWVTTRLNGAPMLRLELSGPKGNQVAGLPDSPTLALHAAPRLFPNPVLAGETVTCRLSGIPSSYEGYLLSLAGKELAHFRQDFPAQEVSWTIPSDLPAGLYLWRHVTKISGQTFISTERLVIHH